MREWLRYFRIWFLVCGIIAVIICVYGLTSKEEGERINKVCTEEERVFDYADVLTEAEEASLRELIAKREKQAQCDIVLVTMNESLEEYAKEYDPYATGNDFTMIKADNFYDEYGFGWNKYKESDDGDGVLLLDNYYREADGKIYTWFSTSGKAMERYSNAMIDRVLDDVYMYIEDNPYEAYKAYVERVYRDMCSDVLFEFPWLGVVGVPLVVAIIFIIANLSGKEGKKTVTVSTYVNGGKPDFRVNRDQFIRKSVSKRRIQTSSSGSGGGGGGRHISSGGHSHGGGGRSR